MNESWSNALRGFAESLVRRLDAALPAGAPFAVRSVSGADGIDYRGALPDSGLGLALTLEDGTGLSVLVDLPALVRIAGDEDGAARDAAAASLGDAFAAESAARVPALADRSVTTVLLAGASWEGGADPVPAGAFTVISLAAKDGDEKERLEILVAESALEGALSGLLIDPGAPAAVEMPEHESLLVLREDPALEARIADLLAPAGGSCRRVTSLGELVAAFSDSEVTGAVVEIRGGRDYLLPMLRSLKDFPGCGAKALVVVLDEATTARVVNCGRLGLYGVLDHDFAEGDLARRLREERTLNLV
ncbi:MAG: hypothetical protein R3F20_11825 [Planctomycetota bacterium]